MKYQKNKMKIKILCKRTGLGNAICFIPQIKELLNQGHYVYCDSDVYEQLEFACPKDDKTRPDRCYVLYLYNRKNFFKERIKYPFAEFYGYKWQFGKRYFSLGYKKAINSQQRGKDMNEVEMNNQLVPCDIHLFSLPGHSPEIKKIALLTSNKKGKYYLRWIELAEKLKLKGWNVVVYGDSHEHPDYVDTPALSTFFKYLKTCQYYISTDNGGMHLADILGIPGIVIWGATQENYLLNPDSIVMHWSELEPDNIIDNFKLKKYARSVKIIKK